MPAIYQQILVKVVPQGQAQQRPIGELRQALTLFLAAVSRDLEGKLKSATPSRTGRSKAGWNVSAAAVGGSENMLIFVLRIRNPVSTISYVQRAVLLGLAGLFKKIKIALVLGKTTADWTDFLAGQISETASFSGFRFETVGQSPDEIIVIAS